MNLGNFVMFINFVSKCCQVSPDNTDRNSLRLSFRRNAAKKGKYYQNINISLYGYGGDYG